MTTYGKSDNGSRVNAIDSRLITDVIPYGEPQVRERLLHGSFAVIQLLLGNATEK